MEAKYIGLRAAIRRALTSCVKSFPSPRRGKYEEPDYTAGIVTELPKVLNSRGSKWGLKFGGCFIHQSPRISYKDDSGVSRSCELGDLLVVCHDIREDRYNAALLQLKMDAGAGVVIKPEFKQLYVYTNWPVITWNKNGSSYCIVPKTASQGALYGVVHPQKDKNGKVVGARVNVASAASTIPVNGQSFEDYLYDVIDFRAGRTFVNDPQWMVCDGWSRLIVDLCKYMKTAWYNRLNINARKVNRGVGGLFALLQRKDVNVLNMNEETESWKSEDSFSENNDGKGHLGVLYIERERRD